MRMVVCLLTFVLLFVCPLAVHAEDWPGWRGPRGDGTSQDKAPTKWDGAKNDNILWKAEIPGDGHSSPIIHGEHVFVATCLRDSNERVLLCLNAENGQPRWKKTVLKSKLETKHALNSYASGTPATDGKLVYVTFLEVDGSTITARNVSRARPVTPGKIVVAAYDFDGKQVWMSKPGEFVSVHGFCSSPVIYNNLLIINGDHDGDSYIVALDKLTGKTVWKVPREHKTRSYVTPLIRKIDGRTQMVFSGSKSVVSLNPDNGKPWWTIDGPTEQFVASMVYDGTRFFMAAGFPTYHVMAIDPRGSGDVTDSHVKWHSKSVRCYVPSPVVLNDYLVVADDRGTVNCFAAESGERHWQARMGKHYSASLITSGGLVYLVADDGITKVLKPGPEPEVVAENKLGENCYSSPAIADGRLFIRGERQLYCIGK